MKLLLDEMYSRMIARELRARGHDVISVHEAPGSGTADEQVFDLARDEERAVVTENVRDYRPLAEALLSLGESHFGLVFTTEKRWPRSDPGRLITALDNLLASKSSQVVASEIWL